MSDSSKPDVRLFPAQMSTDRPAPKRLMRPCDWGLMGSINDLETQLGTVEAYNRLCEAASGLKEKIDRGDARAQNPLFAISPTGG